MRLSSRSIATPRRRLVALAVLAALPLHADVVIPSSVYASGRNEALFVSDVRILNPTSSPVNVTPFFYPNGGTPVTKPFFTIPARSQVAFDNVLESLFGLERPVFGPIRFETAAPIVVSSSVNNRNACGDGSTSGQWLPGLDPGTALTSGSLLHLAASSTDTQGYRTNLVFTNPGGTPATVAVTIRRGDGSLLSSGTVAVPANALAQINGLESFPGVAGTTDTNLWVEYTSDHPVLAFASVISNNSGDPFAILQTADPAVPPVASFSVSPASPTTGQQVTFTDTSTNAPVVQHWSFGDGGTAIAEAAVTHAYAAPGTYKASHFVSNAAGSSAATADVVVGPASASPTPTPTVTPTATVTPTPTPTGTAPATVQVTIQAKQWTYEPELVTLKVGTTYRITWTSTDVLHGVGGLAQLGIVSCNSIAAAASCSVTITPRANHVGTHVYVCTQTSCGAGHNSMDGTFIVEN